MKSIIIFITLIFLTNCSSHSVKFGKKCTKLANDNTYEKSVVWIIDKKYLENFETKINKENCIKNGEKL
tara:strand:- start:299 stop:505 length:207 start_codon:yes stop_codon:yes gene_type:complete